MGSKIAEGKYSLKRKGGKTPNIYLWRNDPEPLLEEETLSEIPTILQTAQASPIPEGLEAIIQGMAAIPTQNQPIGGRRTPPILHPDATRTTTTHPNKHGRGPGGTS